MSKIVLTTGDNVVHVLQEGTSKWIFKIPGRLSLQEGIKCIQAVFKSSNLIGWDNDSCIYVLENRFGIKCIPITETIRL